ncbi:hypothetical protein XENOCAPTIV_027942 [Xenoophorus captivus]|uniref:Uncharacterized protein n=1 Tax=Xenoophorus captivus TaxID=1517983 RepID=A0ABV0QNC3_9TELE
MSPKRHYRPVVGSVCRTVGQLSFILLPSLDATVVQLDLTSNIHSITDQPTSHGGFARTDSYVCRIAVETLYDDVMNECNHCVSKLKQQQTSDFKLRYL